MDVNPDRIWIDHVEEQTIEPVLDAGYWAGMTLYPVTKCSPRRAVDILEKYLEGTTSGKLFCGLGTK